MIIPAIENGIERFVRATLPLEESVGTVSFDPPSGTWSAQLSRLTVNLFLFSVTRSSQEARRVVDRIGDDGRRERRNPAPIVDLAYLVSAYAGGIRDEHALLSDVFTCFAINPVLPPQYLTPPLDGPVHLSLASTETRAKDIWTGVGGSMHASFGLVVSAPLDGLAWEKRARPVDAVHAAATVMAHPGYTVGQG